MKRMTLPKAAKLRWIAIGTTLFFAVKGLIWLTLAALAMRAWG